MTGPRPRATRDRGTPARQRPLALHAAAGLGAVYGGYFNSDRPAAGAGMIVFAALGMVPAEVAQRAGLVDPVSAP